MKSRINRVEAVAWVACAIVGMVLATPFGMQAQAQTTSITITNNTDSALEMYDVTIPGASQIFGAGISTLTVNIADEFRIGTYSEANTVGHTFHISGGQIVADNSQGQSADLGITDQFFQVNGTGIQIDGLKLTVELLTSISPGYTYVYSPVNGLTFDLGLNPNIPLSAIVIPKDGMFSGTMPVYDIWASSIGTFQSGLAGGIASFNDVNSTWAPGAQIVQGGKHYDTGVLTVNTGPYAGEQLFFSYEAPIPEPSTVAFLGLSAALVWLRRTNMA